MPIVIDIDAAELEHMAAALHLTARDMEQASRVAATRVARWARSQIARGLASRLGISQAALGGRRLTVKSGRSGARVWIALNPLNAANASPSRTSRGLRAGNTTFDRAFVMAGRYGRAAMRRAGRARKPLEAASLDVLEAADAAITQEAWPELNARFLAFYTEELERRT